MRLTSAVLENNLQEAASILTRWRHLGAQVGALLLRTARVGASDFSLAEAISLASVAEQTIGEGSLTSQAGIRRARVAIGTANAELGAVLANLQSYTGAHEHG